MTTVQLQAFDIDTGEFIANLPNARQIVVLDDLHDVGMGRMTLHRGAPELVDAPEIWQKAIAVRVLVDGVARFAWHTIVDDVDFDPKKMDKQDIPFDGVGLIDRLTNGLIYPEGGLNGPSPDVRLFAFQSADYTPGPDWVAANTDIGRQSNPTGVAGFNRYQGFPEGFPDPQAFWIAPSATGPSGNGGVAHPEGVWRARKVVTVPETAEYVMALAGDNRWRVWWDGELVDDGNYYRNEVQRRIGVVEAGDHVWSAEIVNSPIGGGIDNPTSLLGSLILADETTETGLGAVVARTDGSWIVLPIGSDPPGMTPGEIIRICFTDVQTRPGGGLPGFSLGAFTDPLDSAGNPWVPIELALQTGNDNMLSLVKRLLDYDVFVRCGPTGVLEAYQGPPGQVRGGVVLGPESAGSWSNDVETFNVALVRTEAGFTEHLSANPSPRREAYIEMGQAPSAEVGATVGDAFVAEYQVEAQSWEVDEPETLVTQPAVGWVGLDVGDTVQAQHPITDELVDVVVQSHGLYVDDVSGQPVWMREVQS